MAEIIKLSIKEFRAIKEANIELNGITVVSGVNGCGKSTLSKFLYYTFKIANNYDEYVSEKLSSKLNGVIRLVNILISELYHSKPLISFEDVDNINIISKKINSLINRNIRSIENKEFILNALKDINNIFEFLHIQESNTNRLKVILRDTLDITDDGSTFFELIDKLNVYIDEIYQLSDQDSKNRPIEILTKELSRVFFRSKLPKDFEICEYGDTIIGNESKSTPIVHAVQKIAYIDTPMGLGTSTVNQPLWNDLNDILEELPKGDYDSSIDHIISSDILKGESKQVESDFRKKEFKFIRENGAEYDLFECATGVKSFSILQTMLRNGFLDSKTLLIIDEPEAHLHPQWIVEYARLIVLLNKNIGVKFFIASHNPDMISAIKYISEKEQVDANLNFYLAEQVDSTNDLYTYQDLGTDIDPIFQSFNIALDRINQYGESND